MTGDNQLQDEAQSKIRRRLRLDWLPEAILVRIIDELGWDGLANMVLASTAFTEAALRSAMKDPDARPAKDPLPPPPLEPDVEELPDFSSLLNFDDFEDIPQHGFGAGLDFDFNFAFDKTEALNIDGGQTAQLAAMPQTISFDDIPPPMTEETLWAEKRKWSETPSLADANIVRVVHQSDPYARPNKRQRHQYAHNQQQPGQAFMPHASPPMYLIPPPIPHGPFVQQQMMQQNLSQQYPFPHQPQQGHPQMYQAQQQHHGQMMYPSRSQTPAKYTPRMMAQSPQQVHYQSRPHTPMQYPTGMMAQNQQRPVMMSRAPSRQLSRQPSPMPWSPDMMAPHPQAQHGRNAPPVIPPQQSMLQSPQGVFPVW